MVNKHPADELKGLRDLLERFKCTLIMKDPKTGQDVSKREIAILKREIAHVEAILARLEGKHA